MNNNELDKLMRSPYFTGVTISEDSLAWVVEMKAMRSRDKWVDINGVYVPNDSYTIYIHKGGFKAPVLTDPRLDYLKPDEFIRGLKPCYIVDIDGTVALIDGRSPYDGRKANTDKINMPIANLIDNFRNATDHATIIFSTGRDEKFREITMRWLQENGLYLVADSMLLMRPADEKKPDAEVKKDNYFARIHGKYNVELVIEDRARVTKMYRDDLRLPTIEPWYSNF